MPEEDASTDAPAVPEQMTVELALEIVTQACAAFQGNLQAHQQIQTALVKLASSVAVVAPTPNRATRRGTKTP